MIHSNSLVQIKYQIPVFINEPFYRFTGLFNESAPLAFYLSISYVFFLSLGEKYKYYKYASLFLLLISGSKASYLFLILHLIFFSRSKVLKITAASLFCYTVYLYFYDFPLLAQLTYGQIASVTVRAKDFSFSDIPLFGKNLFPSSNGEIGLNAFDILGSGFGYFGLMILALNLWFFYRYITSDYKKYFFIPFFVGLISNGSLLIVQYTLIVFCLIYLHHNIKNEELMYHSSLNGGTNG